MQTNKARLRLDPGLRLPVFHLRSWSNRGYKLRDMVNIVCSQMGKVPKRGKKLLEDPSWVGHSPEPFYLWAGC